MADVIYPWNPFQERVTNDIKNEEIRVDAVNKRREFVPRKGAFFSKNVVIRKQGSNVPLVLGIDYAFCHSFNRFGTKYKRNVFASVVLLKPFDTSLFMDYSIIGGPFSLDEAAFVKFVADILNAPREADWDDIAGVPYDFMPDPHDHPAAQTYDYEEMTTKLNSLILIMTQDVGFTVKQMLEEHLDKPLMQAHVAKKGDLGLDLTPNMEAGIADDLAGASANKLVTVSLLKEALRRLGNGTLKL